MAANLKNIMTTAWTIARESAVKFGGKPVQYISGAMKAAWIAARIAVVMAGENNLRSKVWTKAGHVRVYIEYADGYSRRDMGYIAINDNSLMMAGMRSDTVRRALRSAGFSW